MWNSFSACLVPKNDRIGRARLDLIHRGGVIPLGLAPRNARPACPARPVECETYSSGVGQDDRTGVKSKGYSPGGGVLSFDRGEGYRLTMANSQEEA